MINIFLAEDDEFIMRVYLRAFNAAGFHLDTALDGEAAIEKLKSIKEKPDIVILDIMMPKKTGFEVLEFMKKDEGLKDIPVILLTNLYGQQDEKKGLELGAIAYLIKSNLFSEEIVEKIKEVLKIK